MLRFTPALYSDPTNIEINLVACKPTTKHLISHWPSFIGALNSTRSSLNTTRRVYFYVIVKMWFKLPIYPMLYVRSLQRVKKTAWLFKVTELLQNSIEFIQAAVADNQFAFTPGSMLNPHGLTQFV